MMPIPFEEATYVATVTDRFTGGENWEFETDSVSTSITPPP